MTADNRFERRRFNATAAGLAATAGVAPFGLVRAQAQKLKVGVLLRAPACRA